MFFSILVVLSCLACNKSKETAKPAQQLPPEHAKAVESFRKSVEESKKAVVAKVNGIAITAYDLVNEMNSIAPQFIKPGQQRDAKTDEEVRKTALDRLIYSELAVQEAKRQGLVVSPAMVDAEVKKIKESLKTEEAFKQKLATQGVTEAELRKQIEKSMLADMITEKEIFGKVKIDPNLVKKTYEKEKNTLKGPSGKVLTFEEARPIIEQKLMRPLVQKREDEWVNGLKKAAKIEIPAHEAAKEIHSLN